MNSNIQYSTQKLQDLVIRMEHLSQKISSYTCEPNDPSCFEKQYNLKRDFKTFVDHQNRIMGLIKQERGETTDLDKDIRLHLERFKALENDVATYLLEVNRTAS